MVDRRKLYRLERVPLGEGAFAKVWKAVRRADDEIVAFKQCKDSPIAHARMKQEITVQQRLAHPHIMPILDADPDFGWFTMPLAIDNLENLRRQLDEEDLIQIVQDVADGLQVAHTGELIHRDVSPRNILALLHDTGRGGRRWVIADWGLVRRPPEQSSDRLTATGQTLGTEGYAAPEVWQAEHEITAAADVYSLGRVAAWFLTGRHPRPNIPLLPEGDVAHWRSFVRSCTEHDIARRLSDMIAVKQRLNDIFEEPIVSPVIQARLTVDALILGEVEDLDQLTSLAVDHVDDPDVYIDHLARIPSQMIAKWVQRTPADAAEVAQRMARHLVDMDWGQRDVSYASTPLNFVHVVLRTLVEMSRLPVAQDVAEDFFAAEVRWDNSLQKGRTADWLVTLDESAGAVMARALRAVPPSIEYHRQSASWPARSRSLLAILAS